MNTARVMDALVQRVQALGEAGLWNIRQVLAPERGFDTASGCAAAEILSKLQDVASFKPLFSLVARLWQTYDEFKRKSSPAALARVYEIIGNMVEPARQAGFLDEPVLHHMRTAVEAADHIYLYPRLMDAAAKTHDGQVRELLTRYATHALRDRTWEVLLDQDQPWEKPQAALYALRLYPEMQELMLTLTNHPHPEMADTAAQALIEMLHLLPGEGGSDYEAWKTWAVEHVPADLKPVVPGGLRGIFNKKPDLTRQQQIFWRVCHRKHERCHQKP